MYNQAICGIHDDDDQYPSPRGDRLYFYLLRFKNVFFFFLTNSF